MYMIWARGSEKPLFYILSSLLWALLDYVFVHFKFDERIAKRFGWSKRTVRRRASIVNLVFALVALFCCKKIILDLSGFDLFSWQ